MTLPATVTALADFAHIPPGGTELVHHIDEVEIPIADPRRCQHQDTICAECAPPCGNPSTCSPNPFPGITNIPTIPEPENGAREDVHPDEGQPLDAAATAYRPGTPNRHAEHRASRHRRGDIHRSRRAHMHAATHVTRAAHAREASRAGHVCGLLV